MRIGMYDTKYPHQVIGFYRDEENANATENAIASLGKVVEFQSSVVDASQSQVLANVWLNALPLTEDEVEAQNVHRQLIRFIEKQDSRYSILPNFCHSDHTLTVPSMQHNFQHLGFATPSNCLPILLCTLKGTIAFQENS